MSSFFDNWLALRAMSAPAANPVIPYQRIEYIESTGTQYIDTGQHFLFGDEFYFDYMTTRDTGNENKGYGGGSPLDHNISGGGRRAWNNSEMSFYAFNAENKYVATLVLNNTLNKRYVENWKIIANRIFASVLNEYGTENYYITSNSSTNAVANYDSGRNVYIFKDNSDYPNPGAKRVYGCWLKRLDGTLAFNMLPVRVGQVGYLYDTVSGQLFGNLGTGDFVLGSDLTTGGPTI